MEIAERALALLEAYGPWAIGWIIAAVQLWLRERDKDKLVQVCTDTVKVLTALQSIVDERLPKGGRR